MAFLMLLPFGAGAQEFQLSSASLEYNRARSLWFDSGNAAGLATHPLASFNTVDFEYDYETGDYHRMQTGESVADLGFDTQGALAIGKMQLWGHFRYDNISDRGTRFNTVLFDPYDERQIFSVADPRLSDWKRQSYDMEFKAAMSLGERLAAGLHLRYTDRIAAKQVDPRSESFKYSIELRPSLTWTAGKNMFGLSALYSNMFERSVPVLSNVSEMQEVYLLRGLGNYVRDMVGSGGLSTIYYHSDTYGGALQYHLSSNSEMFGEIGARYSSTSTRESATQPFNMGSTAMLEFFGSYRLVRPHANYALTASYRETDATEYTSVWDMDTGKWDVRTSALGSTYGTLSVSARSDQYFGIMEGCPYKWKLSAYADGVFKDDRYLLPEASFSYSMTSISFEGERLFHLKRDMILDASLRGGVIIPFTAEYSYTGVQKDGLPAAEWYPHDIDILGAFCGSMKMQLGLDIPLSGRLDGTSLKLSAASSYLMADNKKHRIQTVAVLGLIF